MIRRLLLIALLALPGSALAAEAAAGEAVPPSESPGAAAKPQADSAAQESAAPPSTPAGPGAEAGPEAPQPAAGAPADLAPQPAADPSADDAGAREPIEGASAEQADPALPSQPGAPKVVDDSVARYRTPFETLSERMIGEASRSVRFDWRRKSFAVGAVGSQLLELNNFSSLRLGGFARTPLSSSLMGELAVTWVFTSGSESTEKLALTPYRQAGRPERLELDLNFGFPLAEGVVTAWPGFFPATELVFSLNAGFRYLYYPGQLYGASFLEIMKAVFQPRLTDLELENLEEDRLPGMEVDGGRYNLMAGFSTDLYFQSGFFMSPRAMVAVPIFSSFNPSGLQWWWELSLGLGWMF